MEPTILVTGGAGFIGFNFIQTWLEESAGSIISVDRSTYPTGVGNRGGGVNYRGRDRFVQGDIGNRALISELLTTWRPVKVVNFAAETHVDRSILFPDEFVNTNVLGSFNLLDEVRHYWDTLPAADKESFRFLQVSTDEVYGSLLLHEPPCDENRAAAPNSPYAASKASADQFVRAFYQTYGVPTQIARCSNNYGPYQHPEKLIPLMILRALRGQPLPIYGDGCQIRDWLYVRDHCAALMKILKVGGSGEVYNISARAERANLQVVKEICALLDDARPRKSGRYADLITHVTDRRGHDRRYALDSTKLTEELGWSPIEGFESGLAKTVRWYLEHIDWMTAAADGAAQKDWPAAQRRLQ